MKFNFKLICFFMIIIICCSLSTVAASDFNELNSSYDNALNHDSSLMAIESDDLDGNEYEDMDLSTNDNDLSINDDVGLSVNDDSKNQENEPILNIGEENDVISDEDSGDVISDSDSLTSNDAFGNSTGLYGIVNFGSNIISLNIYDVKDGQIVEKKSVTETSPTSIYTVNKNLTQEGIENLISILEDFSVMMDLKKVQGRAFFATASMRKIDNSEDVKSIVYERLGINITVLSEEEEATIGFNAVQGTDLTVDNGLLIDLGGGSCEVTSFESKEIVTAESMPLGSNSCYKEFVSVLFPNETEKTNIENAVLANLSALNLDGSNQFEDLFGTGGTIYTIKLMLISFGWIGEDEYSIPVSMLDDLYDDIKDSTKENFQKIMSVDSSRIHTLVPGLIITRTIVDYFNVQTLHFCKSTVEDGLLSEVIKKENLKESIELNIDDINTTSDEDIGFSISLADDAQGTVKIELNNAIYTSSVINGTAFINTAKLDPGDYIAKVEYGGDEKYKSSMQNINVHIKTANLNADDLNRGWNSDYDYQAKLIDEDGNPIGNKLIAFTFAQKTYHVMTDSNGIASVKLKLNVGTYNVTISSPFNPEVTKTLKIVKRIQNNKNLSVYYNSNKNYKVKIIGDNGLAAPKSKSVKVIIDKKSYIFKTDKDGYITIKLNKTLLVGNHIVKIQYMGDSVQNKITVKQVLTSAKSVDVKKTASKLVLSAKLKNVKSIKGQKISFKFNGKTYSAKTDSKGIAKVTIKKETIKKLKKGKTYTVSVTYLKDVIKTKVKVK